MISTADRRIIFGSRVGDHLVITGTMWGAAKGLAFVARRILDQLGNAPQQQAVRVLYQRLNRIASTVGSYSLRAAAIFLITGLINRFAPHLLEIDPLEKMVPDHWREIIRFLPPEAQRALVEAYPNNRHVRTVAGPAASRLALTQEQMRRERFAMLATILGLAILKWKTMGRINFEGAFISAALAGVITCVEHWIKNSPLPNFGLRHALWQSMLGGGVGVQFLLSFVFSRIEKFARIPDTLLNLGFLYLHFFATTTVVADFLLQASRRLT